MGTSSEAILAPSNRRDLVALTGTVDFKDALAREAARSRGRREFLAESMRQAQDDGTVFDTCEDFTSISGRSRHRMSA